jgi:hypothetical protein
MFDLKPLSRDAIPAALTKAERYRLLNESEMAESICEDILAANPDERQAIVTMILAITDQFHGEGLANRAARAHGLISRLPDEYERLYYTGIISERRARAELRRGVPGGGPIAHHWFVDAMDLFERAMALRPPGNDDAVLRWNACARTLERHPELRARPGEPAASVAPEW